MRLVLDRMAPCWMTLPGFDSGQPVETCVRESSRMRLMGGVVSVLMQSALLLGMGFGILTAVMACEGISGCAKKYALFVGCRLCSGKIACTCRSREESKPRCRCVGFSPLLSKWQEGPPLPRAYQKSPMAPARSPKQQGWSLNHFFEERISTGRKSRART